MTTSNPRQRSEQLFARAQELLPGGVDSPVRAYKAVGLSPLFIRSGKGSRITDVDGNEYIDYVGSWGPLILGHAHEQVLAAVRETLERGTSFGAPSELELQLAELVLRAVPSMERVRFVNSGNEATQGAVRVARGFTGRDKLVKFAGCYHGSVDALLVKAGSGVTTLGLPDSPGVPAGAVQDTLLAEFNDLAGVEALLGQHRGQVAGVLVEPLPGNMGLVPPAEGFLQGLRELCDREGCLLIFDEVMSGFRVARGGAQGLLGVRPDLSTFGKVIGGGFPVGAYGGRAEIMAHVAPAGAVYQAGTLSGNPVAMAAGIATLTLLEDEAVYAGLEAKARRLLAGLTTAAERHGHRLQTACYGGMMGFFFREAPVRNYAEALTCDVGAYARFFRGMLAAGVYLAPAAFEAAFISVAHSEADIEQTLAAADAALAC